MADLSPDAFTPIGPPRPPAAPLPPPPAAPPADSPARHLPSPRVQRFLQKRARANANAHGTVRGLERRLRADGFRGSVLTLQECKEQASAIASMAYHAIVGVPSPCPHCQTINPVDATTCRSCRQDLPSRVGVSVGVSKSAERKHNATTWGIAQDKLQLLSGRPTQVVELREEEQAKREAVWALVAKLARAEQPPAAASNSQQ